MLNNLVTGSCLCGAITYEVEIIPDKIYNCHCSLCRKAHGAAYATQVFAKGESLKLLKGQAYLQEYQRTFGIRVFCSQCGANLMNYAPDKSVYLSVALSNVDSALDLKPVAHAFAASKAPWCELAEGIPAYDEMPEV